MALHNWCLAAVFCVVIFCGTAETKELTTLEEQEAMSRKVIALYNSNRTKIYSWQGNVVIKKKKETNKQEELLHTERVDFVYDQATQRSAWNRVNEYRNPKLPGEAFYVEEKSFIRENTYYHHLFQKDKQNQVQNFLVIAGVPVVFSQYFDPFKRSAPILVDYVEYAFTFTILDQARIDRLKKVGRSEEEIQRFISDTQAHGFSNFTFDLEGDILVRKSMRNGRASEIIKIDLSQGGSPISLYDIGCSMALFGLSPEADTTVSRSWDATYQSVNGVWIPRTTRTFQRKSDGTCDITEIEWSDQKINEPIPEERFSLKAIGAVRGMKVRDYRTNSFYQADSDEFPWPEPPAHGGLQRQSIWRYIFMGVGTLLLFAGGIGAWIYKKKETTP